MLYRTFLRFKVIRGILQAPWVYLEGLDTHFLCFKAVRDKNKFCRPDIHCLLTHLLCLRWSGTYFSVHALLLTASLHISSVLRRSGTNSNEYGSMRTASSHISFLLRCSGTSLIQRGTFANRENIYSYP